MPPGYVAGRRPAGCATEHEPRLRSLLPLAFLLIAAAPATAANPLGGLEGLAGLFGGGAGGAKGCKPFKCGSKQQKPVPKRGLIPWANGCGAMGIQVGSGEFNFTRCCDFHDVCFSTCGMTQKICEERFSSCLSKVCESTGNKKEQCDGTAGMFKLGTGMLGCDLFQESQQGSCECVPKKSIIKRRREELSTFLDKHDKLVLDQSQQKLGMKNARKFARMMMDLVEGNYPDSIDIRDPRRGFSAGADRSLSDEL
mmetsp:Transcript_28383/g.69148  ORF Transcript_28383/g.69148 Transcript_28383/m.69148 type:complete len:254 (-) Transcript_28383:120-881(-)